MHVQLRATTVLRLRSLAAGIVGLLTLSLVGCSPQTAPALSDFASHVCANLLRVATAAADPTRTGDRTQYGNAPNLLQADSLYETSWGVRLSALRHRYPHTLNKRATEKWRLDELALAVSRQGEFASAPVGGIRDSIEALVALGGVGKVHGNPFAAFQSKWGYSNVPDGEPDVSTTAMATQGLSALKLRPPTGVVAQFTAAVAAAPNATLSDVVNTEIPALQILSRVESGAAVRRAVPGLEPELNRWNSALLRNGAGGVQLSALWAIRDVALHAGIQVAPVPRKWAVELAAPGGFLALSPGGQGDPQVTYLGVKLGILPASAAMPVLDSGVSRSGWLIASKPTLDSLYDISALHARAIPRSMVTARSSAAGRHVCWQKTPRRHGCSTRYAHSTRSITRNSQPQQQGHSRATLQMRSGRHEREQSRALASSLRNMSLRWRATLPRSRGLLRLGSSLGTPHRPPSMRTVPTCFAPRHPELPQRMASAAFSRRQKSGVATRTGRASIEPTSTRQGWLSTYVVPGKRLASPRWGSSAVRAPGHPKPHRARIRNREPPSGHCSRWHFLRPGAVPTVSPHSSSTETKG